MNKIFFGDCIETLQSLPEKFVHTCVTSPPYFGLRDYGHAGQIGLEPTPDEFVAKLVAVFREVRRVLRDDGTLWLNLGDSYARNASKGGSGPGGKNAEYTDTYGLAQSAKVGSSDGVVGRAARPGTRANVGGLKEKDLIGIPWRVAFALQADGWYLRQDIIWHKPNPMPESVTDRCTKAHEYIFLLAKSGKPTVWNAKDTDEWSNSPDLSERLSLSDGTSEARWRGHDYYFDQEAIKEDSVKGAAGSKFNTGKTAEHQGNRSSDAERAEDGKRNRRDVWTVASKPYKGAHFATFPPDLIEPCILAGAPPNGIVLDPFMGSGTTAMVAVTHGRQYVGCELNEEYGPLQEERISKEINKQFADML